MATRAWVGAIARVFGAISLLTVGTIHLQQYDELYSAIPTIGTLFLLSFFGALAVTIALLIPLERVLGERWGGVAAVWLALIGIGQCVTQFVFLAISERRPLFGFQEPGYDPTAIRATRVAEVVTVVLLTTFLATRSLDRRGKDSEIASAADRRGRQQVRIG